MREILIAGAVAALTTLAILNTPALASSVNEDVALCAGALDSRGVAAADSFRPKFLKFRGGAVRRISVLMIPNADGAQSIEAECRIQRGEVVDVTVKS
jgi:hypothetical protein